VSRGRPLVLYCHPHEFDPEALHEVALPLSRSQRFHQGLGRRGFARKMDRIFQTYPFGPACRLVAAVSRSTSQRAT
jgi:hypothetical protein